MSNTRAKTDMIGAVWPAIEAAASALAEALESLPPGRERSLATTRLQECVMWAARTLTESSK